MAPCLSRCLHRQVAICICALCPYTRSCECLLGFRPVVTCTSRVLCTCPVHRPIVCVFVCAWVYKRGVTRVFRYRKWCICLHLHSHRSNRDSACVFISRIFVYVPICASVCSCGFPGAFCWRSCAFSYAISARLCPCCVSVTAHICSYPSPTIETYTPHRFPSFPTTRPPLQTALASPTSTSECIS